MNSLVKDSKSLSNRFASFWTIYAVFFAGLVLVRAVGPIPSPSRGIIVGVYLVTVLLFLLKRPHFNALFVSYVLFVIASLILSSPPSLFQSWPRLLLFILVLFCVSPIIENSYIISIRYRILYYVCIGCVIISTLSFFAFFLDINYQVDDFGDALEYADRYGSFGGFTTHSMRLAPISGYACVFLFYIAMELKKRSAWILWFLCFSSLLFAASRVALGAIIGATIIQVLTHTTFARSIRILALAFLVGSVVLSNSNILTYRIMGKKESRNESGIFDSRAFKWNARIEEFKSSPVWGVGFAAIDPNGKDYYNPINGQVEPGNSWLAVLSMTGLMGFIPFMFIMFGAYKKLKSLKNSNKVLLAGLFTFVSIHMMAEGYILSAGSFLCVISWLIIGSAFSAELIPLFGHKRY